jgi:hypothetical protein
MNNVREEARSIPVRQEADVLVIGGGPSGVAAAVAAARTGAKTVLVERHGFLGGMWTAGLVTTLAGYNSWLKPYYRCVDGVGGEWLRKATERGFAEDNAGWVLNSDAEGMKLIADALIEDAGVVPVYHTWAAQPIVENRRVVGAFVENVEGRQAIMAKVTVDCTGNGDVIYRSGAAYNKGDTLQPLTLGFDIGNIAPDPNISHTEPRCIPIGPEPVELTGDTLKANASRRLDIEIDYDKISADRKAGKIPNYGGPWFGGLWKDVAWVNTVRVVADGSLNDELTTAEIQGRKDAFALNDYFRQTLPGFENARIQRAGAQIGVRETRRLDGEYILSSKDVRNEAEFDDVIGVGCWSIDIHPNEAKSNHAMFVPRPFQIPYRALVPKDMGSLLAAGRCMSVDRDALATIRVGATCCVTGQAAGAAAALAAAKNVQPADVDLPRLQSVLREQNAILDLPQKQ